MIKDFDIVLLVELLCGAAFIFIAQTINSVSCQYGVFVALPSMIIVPSALFFRAWKMTLVIAFFALIEASFMPIYMGILPVIWLAAGACVHLVKSRYRNLGTASVICLLEVVNLLVMLAYVAFFPRGELYWSDYFARAFSDILASAAVVAAIGYLSVSAPNALLYFMGIRLGICEED